MIADSANPEAVSDDQLKEMLIDGLQNHPVSSEDLLTRICENKFPRKSDEMPISDNFRAMLFRYLLFSENPNQLKYIITVFEKIDLGIAREAWLALPVLANESWYQDILDAWTDGGHLVQFFIDKAFGLPHRVGRGKFKRSLSICLDAVEVNKRLQGLLRRPEATPRQSCYLHSPDMFESIFDLSYSEAEESRHIAIAILANYHDPLIEDRAVEVILDRDGEREPMRINAFFTLMMQNPEKCIAYLWRELDREASDIKVELVFTVVAILLARMTIDVRYHWLCAAMGSSNMLFRGLAFLCVQFEPGDRWVDPMLNGLAKEGDSEVISVILSSLKTVHDQRIADFFLESLKNELRNNYFQFLDDHYPEQMTEEIILSGLEQGGWEIRLAAIQTLGRFHDSKWIPVLKKHCDDWDEDVRAAAIREFAKYDDDSVFPVLTLALLDSDSTVIQAAKEILFQDVPERKDLPPAIERLKRRGIDAASEADKIKEQLQSIIHWGSSFGKSVLGMNTEIVRLTEGLGRTNIGTGRNDARIEVTFDPIALQHKNGCYIVEALILHEIGHHLYDNLHTKGLKSVMGQVKAEGLDELFSFLQDERLERRLRSCWPEYQPHIDRLNSYAFAEQTTDIPLSAYAEVLELDSREMEQQIKSGQRAGVLSLFDEKKGGQQVTLKPVDLMALPGVITPLQAFLLCLIGGFNPRLYHDPRLTEAMSLLPSNFKDLDHAGMLKVARSIRHLLDIPEPNASSKKGREKPGGDGRGGDKGSLSLQAAQALAEAIRQLLELLKSLHIRTETVASALNVPLDLLEAAARGDKPSPALIDEGSGESNVQQPAKDSDARKLPGGKGLNLSKGADFDEIRVKIMHEFDSKAHAELVVPIRSHIRALRAYFELLGMQVTEETGVRQGRRLDTGRARLLPATGNPNIMIRRYDAEMANAYLGIVIDKSGSMDGEEMERAKSFATLICESTRGIRGISGDVGAFDDDTYYHLGTLQRCAVSSLQTGGGNNDAGGLARAAERALASGKQHKLLIMISDGSPTECSVEALTDLVQRLQRDYGIVCVQVAVDSIEHEAFPDFVDLTAFDFHEAVARFGQMIRQHTRHWR